MSTEHLSGREPHEYVPWPARPHLCFECGWARSTGNHNVLAVAPSDPLDAAVIAAATKWAEPFNDVVAASAMYPEQAALYQAITARNAAAQPPVPVRKTWTVTTEHRVPRHHEIYFDPEPDLPGLTRVANRDNDEPVDVVVSVQEYCDPLAFPESRIVRIPGQDDESTRDRQDD